MPAHGFAGTHHRIPPVDVEVQASGLSRRGQQCVDPGPDLLENLADRGDHDGVSNPGDGNAAVTHKSRPLDLQAVVAGGGKAAAGYGHPAAANILEMHLPQVQLTTGARQDTGVGFLVEGMGCNRCRGETAVVAEGLQHEPVVFQYAQGAVRAGAGAGGDGGAFQDLAQVQRQAGIKPAQNGQGGKHRRVVGTTGDHNIAAGGQGVLQRFNAHLGHQRRRLIDGFRGKRRRAGEGLNPALFKTRPQRFRVDIGGDNAQPERQPEFLGELLYDVHGPLQVRPGTGAAGTADHQRDAALYCGGQQVAQVAAHRGAIGKGLACPQVVWPGVGRARVHGNQVRVAGQAAFERRLGKAVTQDGGG